MKSIYSTMLAAAFIASAFVSNSFAGSQAFSCSDASGQLTYDGQELTFRKDVGSKEGLPVKSRKVSETLLSTIEETCINKAGDKFIAGSKTSLLVIEYPQSYDQKLVEGQFLCVEEYDSYPNVDGVDTKCVKTTTKTGRLRDTTIVTDKAKK